jgi:hypothetical protein
MTIYLNAGGLADHSMDDGVWTGVPSEVESKLSPAETELKGVEGGMLGPLSVLG